jgi:hypothetical protein
MVTFKVLLRNLPVDTDKYDEKMGYVSLYRGQDCNALSELAA